MKTLLPMVLLALRRQTLTPEPSSNQDSFQFFDQLTSMFQSPVPVLDRAEVHGHLHAVVAHAARIDDHRQRHPSPSRRGR